MNISFLLAELDSVGFLAISTLLSVLWQSSIVLVVIGILTYILRRKKESLRYCLWVTGILVIPVLPLLTWGFSKVGTPQVGIHVIPFYSAPQERVELLLPESEISRQFETQRDQYKEIQNQHIIPPDIPSSTQGQNREINISLIDYPWALAFAGYVIIALFLLIVFLIERIRIGNWIVNSDAVMDPRIIEVFQTVKDRLAISREIIIIENEHAPAPMVCRTLRPAVILPTGFIQKMSEAELCAVAIHELSHIKHNDMLILAIVSLMRTVFFFHPLVWYASRELSFLAESSCDNVVLNLTSDQFSYADMLSRIARNLSDSVLKTELAIGIIFSKSMFYRRINTIISRQREHFRSLSRLAFIVTIAAVVMSLVMALTVPLTEKLNPDSAMIAVSENEMYENTPGKSIRWMEGKITDSDGNPIAEASLILTQKVEDLREATTDTEGNYRFDDLIGAIVYRLTVHHEDYGNFYFNYLPTNQINDFIIKKAERFLYGKVVDPEGNPIEGARIEIDPFRHESEVVYIDEKTDTAGNFHLKNIFADTVRVYVSHILHGYKVFDTVETNKENVIFTLDSSKDSKHTLSSLPYRPGGSYNTPFVQGQAPAKIDGNLSDWAAFNTNIEHLVKSNQEMNAIMRFSFRSPENEGDLSAKVQCFADMNFVYIAVDVTDDILLFDNHPLLSTCGVDDAIAILFYGDKKIESVTYMWLTCDAQGRPFIEGRDPVTKEPYPYLMESLGVKYALKQTGNGYAVELAVPWSVLKMGGLDPESYMGINLWVYDRDSMDIPHARKMVCWAVNGERDYIEIKFTGLKSDIGSRAQFATPYQSDSFERINHVLQNAKKEEWSAAEEQLKTYDDEPWVKPMLAIVQGKAGEKDEMVKTFIEVIDKTPHLRAAWWAEDHVYSYAKTLEMNRQYEDACNILEKITGKESTYATYYDSHISLGYNYFMSGNYLSAKKTLEELLKSVELADHDPDSQLTSQAHQLLNSIDRAMKRGE